MIEKDKDTKIQDLDENMKANKISKEAIKWFSPMEAPFRVSGFAWLEKDKVYRRVPVNPSFNLSESVNYLANHTAGGQISFQTDATTLSVKVKLLGVADLPHMPATGQCGFDCYTGEPGNMQFVNTAKYNHLEQSYECVLFDVKDCMVRNILLNFPLYQGVKEVLIGVNENAKVMEPVKFRNNRRIVLYGTSITQGGCASRPGMAYTNIISRRLNVECINLGFTGNGLGEPEMAETIAEIERIGCIVIDYEANAAPRNIYFSTLPGFIKILRKTHHDVPILVVSKIPYGAEVVNKSAREKRLECQKFARELVEDLKSKGDGNIYFMNGEDLLGNDFDECTVDGVHPTDLGFMRMANALTPVLETILFA